MNSSSNLTPQCGENDFSENWQKVNAGEEADCNFFRMTVELQE